VRHGKGGSADHINVAIAQAGFPTLLRNYNVNPCDLFNMDETALNFRTLTKASLGTASGKDYVAAKDRLTAVLCVNATGTHNIKPMIIGSAGILSQISHSLANFHAGWRRCCTCKQGETNRANHAAEQWTEAPESDDEEATAAYEAREESDVEEADDSKPVVPMTLLEARLARGMGQALKIFVQENEHMRPYLSVMESMVREMEAMTMSARTHQCDMHDYFLHVRAAADDSPAAGARAD
jgi:hypothetical protein